jgi:FtsZ-binding cell division protein ZapB
MAKWIETQQIISRERSDWQQGREILLGRLELVKKEIATLEEKIKSAEASVAESNARRDALVAENDALKATAAQVGDSVGRMEAEVRKLVKVLPQPLVEKLKPLTSRLPEEGSVARASVAERAQNVLGILNEANKANTEITVSFEVHNLSDGTPSEVQAIYVGLAQAYFVSPKGEAGVGRPGAEGWIWTPSNQSASRVNRALEIIQGKHTPSFVPLPVKIQ